VTPRLPDAAAQVIPRSMQPLRRSPNAEGMALVTSRGQTCVVFVKSPTHTREISTNAVMLSGKALDHTEVDREYHGLAEDLVFRSYILTQRKVEVGRVPFQGEPHA
jgi:hypothetical protein